jgi:3-deoxy-D-manno-octulosonic-acid transferase
MFIIYDAIYLFLFLFHVPILIARKKWHSHFGVRFGFLNFVKPRLHDKRRIWIHAVSVGEVLAMKSLLRHMRSLYKDHQIVLSVVTKTGYDLAKTIVRSDEVVLFAPLDLSWIVQKFIFIINPQIYINAETEIWPNLLNHLSRRKIPVVQVNGRISDQAFRGYSRIRWLIRPVLRTIRCFCMQTSNDAKRVIALGARPEAVHVVGNIKFDDIPLIRPDQAKVFNLSGDEVFWVAGSTHPGEEEIVLHLYQRLAIEFPRLRLIVVPRHPERTSEVCRLIEQKGLDDRRFSQATGFVFDQSSILVVDTIGQLRDLYSLAHIVFVGKSLTCQGGHNIIEPAFFKKPIIVGPYMQNFHDVTQLFLERSALIQIRDQEEFYQRLKELLRDPSLCQEIGERAYDVVKNQQGAMQETLRNIFNIQKESAL